MFSMPAGSEWLIILVIVLVFFGAGRLPDVLQPMGKGVRAFKDASKGTDDSKGNDDLEEQIPNPRRSSKRLSAGNFDREVSENREKQND